MPRPAVSITRPNLAPHLRSHMMATLPRFTDIDGLVGISLNGGLSRGYADDLSEIDLTLYLTPAAYSSWQQGRLPLASGIITIDKQLYDLKVINYDKELAEPWSEVALWDGSYAEVLYDPEGKVAALYAAKLAQPPTVDGVGGRLFGSWWHFYLAGNIWIQREDGLQAHLMLNRAIEPLIAALFQANEEYVPHEKWLVHMSRTLAWRPDRWEERLGEAMLITSPTVDCARRRQQSIAGLWREIDRHVVETFYPGFPLSAMQKYHYEQFKRLWTAGSMPVEQWQQEASVGMLHSCLFHDFVTLADGQVVLDRERVMATGPRDMDPWFYAIVEAVRAGK